MGKNLAIYVQYDPTGNVQDYVVHCLRGLMDIVDEILVVVNGTITPAGRRAIEDMGVRVLVRDNVGLDACAWRAGMEYYGYDKVAEYDNLLLVNNSFYGPIYPFSEMWNQMCARDCDFWGINRHCETGRQLLPYDTSAVVLEHIQSYWLVFKQRVLKSPDFKQYWQNIPCYNDFMQAVAYGECRLTRYFESRGFKSDTYMNFEKYNGIVADDPILLTDVQVINDRMPIIKRKFFCNCEYNRLSRLYGNNDGPRKLLDFLEQTKHYDTKMIWDDLLAGNTLGELDACLHMNFILPGACRIPTATPRPRVAVIIYIYSADMVPVLYSYAKNIPEYIDIIIINTDAAVQKKCKMAFEKLGHNQKYLIQENRGRDQAALLITAKDLIPNYEYVCFIHSKKSQYLNYSSVGDFFRAHCLDSLMFSSPYIENIISTFQHNSRLGVLMPFLPNTSPLNYCLSNPWLGNYSGVHDLLTNRLHLNVKIDNNLMFPAGGMWWFRVDALKPLLDYPWRVTDFPAEPLTANDGLILHAIERSICLVAQSAGYFSAWVVPAETCGTYLGNFFADARRGCGQMPGCDGPTYKDLRRYWLYRLKFHKYRIMSHVTSGKSRQKYKSKKNEMVKRIKRVDMFKKK
ncbi:hypothetical protein HDR61_03230 [bacterium]|nr:hypothetical protein [bacterium]